MTHSSSRSKWKRGFDGAEWRQLQSPALSVAVRVTGARSSDDKSLMIVTNTVHSHVDQGPGAHQSTLNEY